MRMVMVMVLLSVSLAHAQPVLLGDRAIGESTSAPPPGTAVRRDRDANQLTLTVAQVPPQPWQAQVVFRSIGDVSAGDVALVSFRVRATAVDSQTGEAAIQWVTQRAEPPFRGGDEALVVVTNDWQEHEVPLRIQEDMPAGKLQFSLNFGLCRQTLEVADVKAVNLGRRDSIFELRKPAATYPGREPDAPWRAAAAERIEQIRKGNLRIEVVDEQGNPVAGATVRTEMTRHAFAFGTAVVADRLLGERDDDRRYREVFLGNFNAAVFEYEMKWPFWERGDPPARRRHRERVIEAVRWLRDHEIEVRGHAMIWPGWGDGKAFLPIDVINSTIAGNADAVRQRIMLHIMDIGRAFSGQLAEWDVVNEPLHNQRLQELLGEAAIVDWFRLARRADPNARLYLNEFAMLSYGALDGAKIDRHYALLSRLINSGTPMHGIGEQAHFRELLIGPARMIAILDRFAMLGLPIRITEFDVAVEDEQLQADYTRDFLTAAFSHPAVNGVILWGFWARQHWQPSAGLWRGDWTIKPNGQVLVDLIRKQWWTDEQTTTDSRGRAEVRGFLGDYRITVTAGDREALQQQALTVGGETIRVVLK